MPTRRASIPWQDRLWTNIKLAPSNDCWEYSKSRYKDGYGQFSRQGVGVRAHRAAWESINGSIPNGVCVLHKCDNPACCRPDHLFLGTEKDNAIDREQKGRRPILRGEFHGGSKLSDADVREIKSMSDHFSHRQLGEMFGVTRSNIQYIVSGKSRKSDMLETTTEIF